MFFALKTSKLKFTLCHLRILLEGIAEEVCLGCTNQRQQGPKHMPVMVLSSLERYALVQMVTKAQLLVLVFGCISFLRSSPPFPLCLLHFSITWIEMGMLLLTSEWLCEQNGYYNHMHLLLLSTVWLLDSCLHFKEKQNINNIPVVEILAVSQQLLFFFCFGNKHR